MNPGVSDPETKTCKFCHGLGRCGKCAGLGIRKDPPDWLQRRKRVSCTACEGTGKCPLCKGTGVAPATS